jgi:hypothetical protein
MRGVSKSKESMVDVGMGHNDNDDIVCISPSIYHQPSTKSISTMQAHGS